jgi:hypothetical protein
MKYMIMLYGSQRDYDAMAGRPAEGEPGWTGAELAAMGEFMAAFNNELVESGEFVDAQGLDAPVHTRRVGNRGGEAFVTDGPYPETAEVLAGYTIVDCAGLDRATEIAARLNDCPAPAAVRARAWAEIRPLAGAPDGLAG